MTIHSIRRIELLVIETHAGKGTEEDPMRVVCTIALPENPAVRFTLDARDPTTGKPYIISRILEVLGVPQ